MPDLKYNILIYQIFKKIKYQTPPTKKKNPTKTQTLNQAFQLFGLKLAGKNFIKFGLAVLM